MKIEGEISLRGKRAIARSRYQDYRGRRKESKVYIAILFAMCEGRCPECGRNMILSFDMTENERDISATLDHTIPLYKELEHKKFGLQIMCKQCNGKKGKKNDTK